MSSISESRIYCLYVFTTVSRLVTASHLALVTSLRATSLFFKKFVLRAEVLGRCRVRGAIFDLMVVDIQLSSKTHLMLIIMRL